MLFVHKTTYLIMRACPDIRQSVLQVLARLANIHQALLFRLADICPALLRGLASLANVCKRPFLKKFDSPLLRTETI